MLECNVIIRQGLGLNMALMRESDNQQAEWILLPTMSSSINHIFQVLGPIPYKYGRFYTMHLDVRVRTDGNVFIYISKVFIFINSLNYSKMFQCM